jgi:hypothetical protein
MCNEIPLEMIIPLKMLIASTVVMLISISIWIIIDAVNQSRRSECQIKKS